MDYKAGSRYFTFIILFIYFQREGKGGRKRGRETLICETLISCLLHALNQEPGLQNRHVLLPGRQPFALLDGAQPTEPSWSGLPSLSHLMLRPTQ